MKRKELKQLIRESVKSALNENFLTENIQDPTKEEMVQFLTREFGRMADDKHTFRFDMEGAIYWFAYHYHGGQWSNLYSVLSTSQFRPGAASSGPEKDSMEEDMYKALEAEFGGQEHQHGTEFDDANRREVDSMVKEPPHPGEGDDWRNALQETGREVVLKYLDNGYYILSPQQAKEFSVDGKLPRPGYEKKADISKLKGAKADYRGQIRPLDISDEDSAWIHQTPTWGKQVWAIRIHKRALPMREDGAAGGGQGGPGAPGTGMGNVTANVDPIRVPFGGGRKHPKDVPAHRQDEGNSEDDEALYVEYVGQMQSEEPFMLGGQKFEYVKAKYPSGKVDIGVYAFAGDVVYGYQAFRQMHNLKEAEITDPSTGEVAPGPRDRFEMQPGGYKERKPIPSKVNGPKIKKALSAIGLMKGFEWHKLVDRARKNYQIFPTSINYEQELNIATALQYMDEHPEEFGKEPLRESVVPKHIIKLKELLK